MGRILAINTQVTETDIIFGQVTFNAYIGSSDIILVPLALIEDAFFDMNAYVARKLGTRLGRQITHYGTVGTGSNQPTGISTAVTTAGNTVQGATGETTSLVYNDLVNTQHLVDPAYRNLPSCKWMFHDLTLKALKKLVDSANRRCGLQDLSQPVCRLAILDAACDRFWISPSQRQLLYPVVFGALRQVQGARHAPQSQRGIKDNTLSRCWVSA